MHRTDASHHIGVGRLTVESISRSTLRASVACSRQAALLFIIGALALSWIFVYFAGGVDSVVPHFYYIPILFAAVRFGPRSALVVALVSGVLAGPVTFAVVSDGSVQDLSRWLTRIAFFVGIGQMIAWTVGPTLAPIGEEVRRLRKELEIRGGIARREFYLMYQPILSLKSSRYVGVEALVRWRKSSGEEVSPADFISIAERSGLIHDLTAFVLEEACQQASIWHELADHNQQQPWYVSVNISGRDLGLPDLAEKIKLTMEKTGVPPSLLHVEITESELARQDAGEQLQQLRQLGVLIAIDDFGTGYSSLSYL